MRDSLSDVGVASKLVILQKIVNIPNARPKLHGGRILYPNI